MSSPLVLLPLFPKPRFYGLAFIDSIIFLFVSLCLNFHNLPFQHRFQLRADWASFWWPLDPWRKTFELWMPRTQEYVEFYSTSRTNSGLTTKSPLPTGLLKHVFVFNYTVWHFSRCPFLIIQWPVHLRQQYQITTAYTGIISHLVRHGNWLVTRNAFATPWNAY